MPEVLDLLRRVYANRDVEFRDLAVGRGSRYLRGLDAFTFERLSNAGNGKHFLARQLERRRGVALLELKRKYAHPDQVGTMDALKAFRQGRFDAEQHHALRRPVAR